MKKLILLFAVTVTALQSFSQLKGSGKTVAKTYDYNNFSKINLEDLDGKFEVEVGKPFSVSITIDDNLLYLLSVVENSNSNTLTIALKGNANNKMYIEDTKIKVKVTLPTLTAIINDGNGNLNISGISGNYLKIETLDNGSTTASGTINNLEVKNFGNGVLNAENLTAKNAKIQASGNGNATLNVADLITAKTSGNNTVINIGKAKFDSQSSSSGNSRFTNQ